ncbi:MAG: pentapeptide repeat-containing protein [Myxococcota bacterium]
MLERIEAPGIDLSQKEFYRCTFRHCKFRESHWLASLLEDCTFEDCDLTNLHPKGIRLRDVKFVRCKLLGVDWTMTGAHPVVSFTECQMRYQLFVAIKLKNTQFVRCSLVECSFIDADLTKTKFTDCDLLKTVFERCELVGADLSTSRAVFFDPAQNRIKDARISVETAALIAQAMGMIVEG